MVDGLLSGIRFVVSPGIVRNNNEEAFEEAAHTTRIIVAWIIR